MVNSQRSQIFNIFCTTLLDKFERAKGVTEKKCIFEDYLQDWRRNYGPNYYDPLRLLMPLYCRRMFNLKETALANVISKALSISPNSPDGSYLKGYRKPQKGRASGVFHLAVLEVLQTRSLVKTSTQTVKDVNDLLDELSTKEDQGEESRVVKETINQKQVKIFKKMIESYTPHQIQWIIRIILKDLRIGISEQSILSVLHPNAKELFDAGRSLEELCQTIANPHSGTSQFNGVKLFSPCIPQCGFKCLSKNLDANFNKLSKPFYSEQKLDGERMLMHYDPDTDKFAWFTRRKNDNSSRYGRSSEDMKKLSGHIYQGLPNRSIILDGEMVAYSPEYKSILPFGTLKSTSVNDKGDNVDSFNTNVDIMDPTKEHPCYIVFDILYYAGQSLVNNPLKDRIKLLDIVVKNQNNHMRLIPRVELNTIEEVKEQLEEAIKRQEEGLIIKDPNSKYVLNSRLPSWIKFKPEYMDSMKENCDLLVVGVKYGSGKYGGRFRQVLCAVRDDRIPLSDPPKFVTFAMTHSGFSDLEVNELQTLVKTATDYNPKRIPPWVIHPPTSNEKPDKLIDFGDAIVVEVKGTEIIPSLQFGTANTLRFPRIVGFRKDKGWEDIMLYSEFEKAKDEGRRGQKRAAEEKAEYAKINKKRKTYTFIESQQGFDTTDVKVETSLFENLTFFVMNGDKEYGKNDIERLIHINGGKFIQNKHDDTIVIGSDEETMPYRLQIVSRDKLWSVVRAQYIIDCIELQDILPYEPKYMFVLLDDMKKEFMEYMDEYGDYYTKYVDEDSTRELIERMGKDKSESDETRLQVARGVGNRYFAEQLDDMLFLNVVAYFDHNTTMSIDPPTPITVAWVKWKKLQEEMQIAKDRFEFEMGQSRTSTSDQEVTHVIVNKKDLSRLQSLRNDFYGDRLPRFVTLEWIQACMQSSTLANELDYQPPPTHPQNLETQQ